MLQPLRETLDGEEAARDTFGTELLFANLATPLGQLCAAHCAAAGTPPANTTAATPSFGGYVSHAAGKVVGAGGVLPPPVGGREWGMAEVVGCAVAGGKYEPPPYGAHFPRLLPGVTLPELTLQKHDGPTPSRDADASTRSMLARLSVGGGGYGGGHGGGPGGGYGGGGYGGGGGGPPHSRRSGPADRMIRAQLQQPRR